MSDTGARRPAGGDAGAAYILHRGAFPAVLALLAASGVGILALVSSRSAEPVGLMLLAILATLGIFFLFALAARHVRIGERSNREDLLAAVFDAADGAVQITDTYGVVLAANRTFRELVGVGALGEVNTLETLFARDNNNAEALFRLTRAAERGELLCEQMVVSERGASYFVSVKPLRVPGQSSACTCWLVRDITQERAREAAAIGSVRGELAHYDSLPIGLVVVRRDGHILRINERLARWLGHPVADGLRDKELSALVSDDGAALLRSASGAGEPPAFPLDLDLVAKDGRRWPARLVAAGSGDTFAIAVIPRPEASTSVREQRSAEVRYARYFQAAPFGIAMVDRQGELLNSNPAFARLLLDGRLHRGTGIANVLARSDQTAVAKVEAALVAAFSGKATIAPFDITVSGAGREFTRRVYTHAIVRGAAAGEAAILYVVDVTDQKALELKVAQGQKMEAVGTLAGGIAHDFNNVLTAIIGFSDLLLQTHKPGNPAYKNILSIKSSANRAAGLVGQLLAFSRRQTLQPTVLQLNEVMTDLSLLLNRLLGEKIELKIQSGRDLWPVSADRTQLEQVLINLAVNARDAMLPDGGLLTLRTANVSERESLKLEGEGVQRGEYVLIEVRDTGSGMSPEVLAKIFEPFFTTKAVGKGTGLGLATVYGIVKQTGGFIFADSAVSKGTTFRVYLPRHQQDEEEETVVAVAPRKERARDLTGTGRVLIVEDEDAVRQFVVEALKSKGYDVLQAADGVEALEIMQANGHRVDLVVSDVIMPEMNGPTLMKELRKTTPGLKFIFVSGYPDDHFKHSLDPDADFTFLPKPYSLAQIAAKVKEQLGR
jgi:two-component system cell cycle sensor histidine kinase/response regulator CckA